MKKQILSLTLLLLFASFMVQAAPAAGTLKKAGVIQEMNLSDMLMRVDGVLYVMDPALTASLYKMQRTGRQFSPGQTVVIEYRWLNETVNDSNKMVVDIKEAIKQDNKK